MPVDRFMYVPYYDPAVVFHAPRAGFAVGGAINFGFGFNDWASHRWFIHGTAWGRTWANRAIYVHDYPAMRRFDRLGPRGAAAPVHPEGTGWRAVTERSRSDSTGGRRQEERR